MNLKDSLCSTFASFTFIILAAISAFKFGRMDMNAIFELALRTIPATIIMGILGRMLGSILDSPKNLADSDYQTDILKALKKIDKKMTLSDLSEKLTPIEEEPADIELQMPLETEEGNKNEPT